MQSLEKVTVSFYRVIKREKESQDKLSLPFDFIHKHL
jgi:hypothetical protein